MFVIVLYCYIPFPLQNTNVGTTLFDASATDDDIGDNGEIIFSLQGNSVRELFTVLLPDEKKYLCLQHYFYHACTRSIYKR